LSELVRSISSDQLAKTRMEFELVRDGMLTRTIPGRDNAKTAVEYLLRDSGNASAKTSVPLDAYLDSLERLAITAELKEDSSGRHMYRVGRLARLLAEFVGEDATFAEAIEHAARLHDLGKLGLPDEIVMNSGTLTPEQHQAMQMHCEIGAQMIDQAELPALMLAREVAMSHHERWDGTGYPQKLKGEAIPLAARIASIAEVYDVLTSERSYRAAYTHEQAVATIEAGAGKQFDPTLVHAFAKLIHELWQRHGEELPMFLAETANESSFLQAKDEMIRLVDAL
jgi:putative two-component system response regulator